MLKIDNNFDLKSTITCGQIFRYKEINNGYIVIIKDRVLKFIVDNDYIIVTSNNEDNLKNIVYDYLDLNRDYDIIDKKLIEMDKKLESAIKYSKGLKMIHQDPFETLISYIISQNNRVTSIANSLNLISEKYGDKINFEGNDYYLFPSISKLSKLSIDEFRTCKVGFRDKYLYEIMRNIENNSLDLESINDMDGMSALNYLIKFKGIGMKVASCILLFSYQKFDVYPVDTWVKKFMKEDYNIEGESNIREFTLNKYGNFSGIAIQYMFNYKRNKM